MTSSGLRPLIEYDSVIPSMADVEDESSQRLMEEIQRGATGDGDLDAKEIVRELCQKACDASRHLQNLENHLGVVHASQYFGKTSPSRIALEVNDANATETNTNAGPSTFSLVYTHKATKSDGDKKAKPFVVKVNAVHYNKLRDMFHSIHDTTAATRPMNVAPPQTLDPNPNRYSPATNIFHHLIFCILLRYASLSGAQQLLDLRGGGMQGAIHSEVFECLEKQNQCEDVMECFASPLNVYNSRFFSIFHQDLDCHFGSCGDFFSVPLGFFRKGGTHEANPPFSPGLMQRMVERMEGHLSFADSSGSKGTGRALSFVIVVPSCSKGSDGNLVQEFAATSFKCMLKSEYFSKHIVLNAREHGYIEGSQHLRPTRFKESQYDTSVVILQSKAAKDEEKVSVNLTSREFEAAIRTAFASRHQLELEERRNAAMDSDADNVGEESKEKVPPETKVAAPDKKKRTKKKSASNKKERRNK